MKALFFIAFLGILWLHYSTIPTKKKVGIFNMKFSKNSVLAYIFLTTIVLSGRILLADLHEHTISASSYNQETFLPALDTTNEIVFCPIDDLFSSHDSSANAHDVDEQSFFKRKIQEWAMRFFITYILAKEVFDSFCYRVNRNVRSAIFHL